MLFDFIRTHYELIISVITLIISIIVFVLRKKPINDILSYIFQACLKATKDVEASGIKGSSEKLACAVQIVIDTLKMYFPGIDIKIYSSLIVSTIEEILSTPSKK